MGFPFTTEDNFDDGAPDAAVFDTETDTASQLDFAHYTELAGLGMTPYKGAYCMRLRPVGATEAFLTDSGTAVVIALAATEFVSFAIYLGEDLHAQSQSDIEICRFEGTGDDNEMAFGLRCIDQSAGDGLRWLLLTDTDADAAVITANPTDRPVRGRWYWVELTLSPAAAGAGTITVTVTQEGQPKGSSVTATQTGFTNIVGGIDSVNFGMQGQHSSQTGTILLDAWVHDADAVIPAPRYPWASRQSRSVTKDLHAMIGPGCLENVSLVDVSGDATIKIYDTDIAETSDDLIVAELEATASGEIVDTAQTPVEVQRGAYCVLGGTTPKANLNCKPRYMSRAGIRAQGLSRGAHGN